MELLPRAMSMRETSKKLYLATLNPIPNVISSQESVSGAMPLDRQDGMTELQFGQAPAPVNPSPKLERGGDLQTADISGRFGTSLSLSASLTESLANKLRPVTDTLGSTLFRLTWKEHRTPLGRLIYRLVASVRPTSDNVYGSSVSPWPTPCQQDGPHGGPNQGTDRLPGAAAQTGWPTPKANDPKGMSPKKDNLPAIAVSSWATPASQEAGGTPEQFLARKQKAKANGSSLGISLTSLSLQAQLTDSGKVYNGFPAETEKPGQLNPGLSRWFMGLPPVWDDCAVTAMQSMPKRRKRS